MSASNCPLIDRAITVGQLREALEGRADDEKVVAATGRSSFPFLPVFAVAEDETRFVLEL